MAATLVLGLESSCDETACGIVAVEDKRVLANVIASQHSTHARYGGVVPELASREHLKALAPVIEAALGTAGIGWDSLGGLAVTYGPGLSGSLHVGLAAVKGLALALGLPWVGVNHLEGHLTAGFLEHPGLDYPYLGLLVSGGHTALYKVLSATQRERLVATVDDAAGEAFDKVAKLLDLGYPGGPAVDGAARAYAGGQAPVFPQARLKSKEKAFSYSGLKTAVRVHLENAADAGQPAEVAAVAAGFQRAAIRPLLKRVIEAARDTGYTRLVAGGGVACNSYLRAELMLLEKSEGLQVFLSSPELCVDNGAMIAYAGGLRLLRGERSPLDLTVAPDLHT